MIIYLIDDEGGHAKADGPKAREYADALIQVMGFRETTKGEYERAKALIDELDTQAAKEGRLRE